MYVFEVFLWIIWTYATFWAAYVLVFPMWAQLHKLHKSEHARDACRGSPFIAVLVPAHNMEMHISNCIESVRQCDYPAEKVKIYVIADHCSDETAERADSSGAEVLARVTDPAGKSYALAWVFDQLKLRGIDPDLHVVIDATVLASRNFLSALSERWQEGEEIIVGHASIDPAKHQWFVRCMGLTLAHRKLQNEARQCLGLSSLIEGRAMAYSRSYISRFGWSLAVPDASKGGSHPTEDWRHGVRAVASGCRVSYANDAKVYTPLRDTLGAATKQGLRWERGRVSNAMTYGLALLREAIRERSRLKLFAALDSIQPPVAILGGLSFALSLVAVVLWGKGLSAILFSLPALMFAGYAVVVVVRGRRDGIGLVTLLWAPIYLGWRCLLFAVSLTGLDWQARGGKGDAKRGGSV